IADRITILRNGALVGTFEASSLSKLELVAKMLGRSVEPPCPTLPADPITQPLSAPSSTEVRRYDSAPILIASHLSRRSALAPTELTLHRGEIVGLAGLLGSGRTELARLLFAADRATSGTVEVDVGAPQSKIQDPRSKVSSPRQAIALGLALCPEDRKTDGLF